MDSENGRTPSDGVLAEFARLDFTPEQRAFLRRFLERSDVPEKEAWGNAKTTAEFERLSFSPEQRAYVRRCLGRGDVAGPMNNGSTASEDAPQQLEEGSKPYRPPNAAPLQAKQEGASAREEVGLPYRAALVDLRCPEARVGVLPARLAGGAASAGSCLASRGLLNASGYQFLRMLNSKSLILIG